MSKQDPKETALLDVEKKVAQTILTKLQEQGVAVPTISYISKLNSDKSKKEDEVIKELKKDATAFTDKKTNPDDPSILTGNTLVTHLNHHELESAGIFEKIRTVAGIQFIVAHGAGIDPERLENFVLVETVPVTAGTNRNRASDTVQIFKREKVYV